MPFQELKGRRAVAWMRCSTDQQAETSIPDQLEVIRTFAKEQGIEVVDSITLDGVSGSVETGIDRAVDELIQRKRSRGDFNCILIHDPSRFSRSGARHTASLRYKLDKAGLEVVSAIGYSTPNAWTDVFDSMTATQAREYSKSIAAASARGSQTSLEQGRSVHCTRAPYGIDRLLVAEDGSELFVLRNLADGSQLRLDPSSGETLERFGPNRPGRPSSHFRKAHEQRIILIPGDARAQSVIRQVYLRYLTDGWGAHRIARELNDAGIPSPAGAHWSTQTIRGILRNSVYTGIGFANMSTRAIYFKRSSGKPTPAASHGRKTESGRPAKTYRDETEWVRSEHPRLVDFLSEDLREQAVAFHQREREAKAGHQQGPPLRDKHLDSLFILKHILVSKDGHRMSGRRSGKDGSRRYYAINRAQDFPTSDSILRRRVRAEPIEAFVLEQLQKTLVSIPALKDKIFSQTLQWQKTQSDQSDRREIEREIVSMKRRIKLALELDEGIDDDDIKSTIAEFVACKRSLERRLDAEQCLPELAESEVEEVVDALLLTLSSIGKLLDLMTPADIRKLLETVIESAVVDLETMEFKLVIRIPSWAQAEAMGLGECFESETYLEAHSFLRVESSFKLPRRYRRAS